MLISSTVISGCTTTKRIEVAAATQGKIDAGVVLPKWPEDCRRQEAHAAVEVGAELRSVIVRERSALDRQNARTERCSIFYDDVKTRYRAK
ncbi:hypothetical protein [Rhizobium grahamii]|uniref:Uncharacterized protein n=1 Tax=Rhizobium grahamii CCGE 502 TaxID=990285 RepID=S3HR26_9HYPH|nr:hypothetical protein [Rhizobium grahamii]EPE95696.1 hypothetical protein RGCCGE502_22640 [Rhizobium grahamii CCGE 502]